MEVNEPTPMLTLVTAAESTNSKKIEMHTKPVPSKPRRLLEKSSWSLRRAQSSKVRARLNRDIKDKILARIPRAWSQSASRTLKDKDVLLVALRYLNSLRDRLSGTTRAPASLVEIWSLGRLWHELCAVIPENIQKEATATIKAQVIYPGSIHILVAVDHYLDELESAVGELGEEAVQSLELIESEDWHGLSESNLAHQGGLELIELEEGEYSGISDEIKEQSRNIEAFEEALARIDERHLCNSNLAPTATEANLKELFSEYKIESIRLFSEKGRKRQYGFLNLKNADAVESAISNLSGKGLLGHRMTIQIASDLESSRLAAEKDREVHTEAEQEMGLRTWARATRLAVWAAKPLMR